MKDKNSSIVSEGLMGGMHWSEWAGKRADIMSIHKAIGTTKPLVSRIIQSRAPDCRILDVGSGNLKLRNALAEENFKGIYKTLDIDPAADPDYKSIDEVREVFDVVVMLEVIEHLTLDDTIAYLKSFHFFLREGGVLIISTPDPSHPTWIREDISHIQYYPYQDFSAILQIQGFSDIEVFRVIELVPLTKYPPLLRNIVAYFGIAFRNLLTRLTAVNFEFKTIVFVCKA